MLAPTPTDARRVVMGGVVLALKRQRQAFNRTQGHPRHILNVLLFILQPSQVKPVGAIYPIDDRKNQQRGLPAEEMVGGAEATRDRGASNIVRESHVVALLPNLAQMLAFGEREHHSDR